MLFASLIHCITAIELLDEEDAARQEELHNYDDALDLSEEDTQEN